MEQRKLRPRRQRQPADSNVDSTASCELSAMERLPQELLETILAMVPMPSNKGAGELLALRRVSKRWSATLLSPAVWRHRRLVLNRQSQRPELAVLELAPELAEVRVSLHSYGTFWAKRIMLALAETHCKISTLTLQIPLSDEFESAVVEALEHQDGLLELHLVTQRLYGVCYRGDVAGILKSLVRLTGLKSLSVCWLSAASADPCGSLDLGTLKSLQSLRLREGTTPALQRSLLEASKASLVEVDVGSNTELLLLLGECAQLRSVTLGFGPDVQHLHHLKALTSLQTLRLWLPDSSSWDFSFKTLSDFLGQNPQLPWQLWIVRAGRLHDASSSLLERVYWLEDSWHWPQRAWMELLEKMLNLRELLVPRWYKLKSVVAAWNARTAPELEVLHAHDRTAEDDGVSMIQSLRPNLKICLGAGCRRFKGVFPQRYPF